MRSHSCLLIIFIIAWTPIAKAQPVFESVSFDQACKRAGEQKKLVFIDFYTDWCAPCKVMDTTTFVDAAVVAALKARTVPIKVDADADPGLTRRFNVDGYPTMLLVKPDGTELGRILGFRSAADFLDALEGALTGKDAETLAREAVAATGGADATARMRLGRALAGKGKFDEALAEFLWCFDSGATRDAAFETLRRGVLLDELAALARQHPPALAEVSRRRDAIEARIIGGKSDFGAVLDYSALNRALHQTDRTLVTFDKLPGNSAAKLMLFADLIDDLLEARRFADVVAMADPLAGLARKIDDYRKTREDPAIRSEEARQMLLTALRDDIRLYAARMTLALAGAERREDASSLIQSALAFDDSADMRAAIRSRLEQADIKNLDEYRALLTP